MDLLTIVKLVINVPDGASLVRVACLSGKGARFEEALFTSCCTTSGTTCQTCSLNNCCSLPLLTGRILSPDPELLRRHQKPGLPYIFEAYKNSEVGDSLTLSLCLLGAAGIQLGKFIATLQELAGCGDTLAVAAADYQDNFTMLQQTVSGDYGDLPLLSLAELTACRTTDFIGCKRLRFDLLTPVRLVHDGHEVRHFEAKLVLRSFIRRITALAGYYGDRVDPDVVLQLIAASDAVSAVRRISEDKNRLLHQRGITGSFELTGNFELLGPLLAAGSLLHLGKGASYGMGAFAVSPTS